MASCTVRYAGVTGQGRQQQQLNETRVTRICSYPTTSPIPIHPNSRPSPPQLDSLALNIQRASDLVLFPVYRHHRRIPQPPCETCGFSSTLNKPHLRFFDSRSQAVLVI
ncbi:hypothetical protein FJTKL_14741 [Diaporthe vaccinii]|uniref:Uncharacterized protein n=1 Tax=Diaporthe vaccinii TaxID=105482 RepID=A0ABR4F7S8_9PEZI